MSIWMQAILTLVFIIVGFIILFLLSRKKMI